MMHGFGQQTDDDDDDGLQMTRGRGPRDRSPHLCYDGVIYPPRSPADVVDVNLRVVTQAPLVGTSTVVVLHPVRVEHLYFSIVELSNSNHA